MHWDMFNKGVHFTKGRFVPLEFMLPALQLGKRIVGAQHEYVALGCLPMLGFL